MGCVYTSKSGLDLNWICFERDPEVGQIDDLNWIGSAISWVNARPNLRSTVSWLQSVFRAARRGKPFSYMSLLFANF